MGARLSEGTSRIQTYGYELSRQFLKDLDQKKLANIDFSLSNLTVFSLLIHIKLDGQDQYP